MNFVRAIKCFHCTYFLLLFTTFSLSAQSAFSLLNRDVTLQVEKHAGISSGNFHSNIKPYLLSETSLFEDTFIVPKNRLMKFLYLSGSQSVSENKFDLAVAPILTVLPGYEFSNSQSLLDTRLGGKINLNFRKKIALEVQLINLNASLPNYLADYAKENKVIAGNGYAYYSALGYTNVQWNGYLSYTPNTHFNFALGRGKNFFGDGYRSLLLSDVSNNCNYFKITTSIWKIKYVNLFTHFTDIRNSYGKTSRFKNKYATFHYLSWNATKRINISFFESIIWQSRDTSTRNLGYDVNYLNPVIFYRPTEYSLGSSDNAFIGASFKISLFKKQQLYGQVLIDEFLLKEVKARSGWWANKQGFQAGLKSFDVFKINNLFFQLEWNYVRPYTYAHSNTYQNYGHFNESLAHPLGANFSEYFMGIKYQYKLLLFDLKITSASVGLDSSGVNFGQNIYRSNNSHFQEFGNATTQGLKTQINTLQVTLGYLINRANNIRLELGVLERYQSNVVRKDKCTYLFIGIHTALSNLYRDF